MSEETKKKISEKHKERFRLHPEYAKKLGESNRRRWRENPEFREKMLKILSESHKEKKLSEEHRKKLSLARQSKPKSVEFRHKISEIMKARWSDPVWRAKAISVSRIRKDLKLKEQNALILKECEKLERNNIPCLPLGLTHFPKPDIIYIKNGMFSAIEILNSKRYTANATKKEQLYSPYFQNIQIIMTK
jgi:hypothetical protein